MAIEIIRYEQNTDSSKANVVASFDFTLSPMKPSDMCFRGWRVIRTKAGGMFVSPPSCKVEDKWFPLVEFQGDSQKNLCNKLLELLEPYMKQPTHFGGPSEGPSAHAIPDAPVEMEVPF